MFVFIDDAAAYTNKSISISAAYKEQGGLFHRHTNIGFSGKSRGPLLFLICVCEKEASGSDLKHTVTCLATEPLGLLMSAERM